MRFVRTGHRYAWSASLLISHYSMSFASPTRKSCFLFGKNFLDKAATL
nr:MAG TPA: hypothetical protein [Caudoviricetes sp.]